MKVNLTITLCSILISTQLYAQEDKWQPLFNGKDLTNWEHVGEGQFVIEDGILKTQGGMGLLCYTAKKFNKSVIRVVYKNPDGKNAGVFIRIPIRPTEAWMPVRYAYEVQIDDRQDDYHITGVLYSFTKAKAKPSKPGEWNTMEITLDDNRTLVHVNGVLVTDHKEGDPSPPKVKDYEPERGPRPIEGYIGLQNHDVEDVVYFKEISVRDLK